MIIVLNHSLPKVLERFQIDIILKDVLSSNLSVTKSIHNVLMTRWRRILTSKLNSGNSVIKQNIWDDIISLAAILDINLEVKERN